MNINEIIQKTKALSKIVNDNVDFLGIEASDLRNKHSIISCDELKSTFLKKENTDRLLQIGIVGRVKAGKSSLLNALLFDGESVLPKAATPMTAALTIVSYGDKISATADLYTEEDLKNIHAKAQEYKIKLETLKEKKVIELKELKERKLRKEKSKESGKIASLLESKTIKLSQSDLAEIDKRANSYAKKELGRKIDLAAAYDQDCKIRDSKIKPKDLASVISIEASTKDELKEKLKDFVGSEGKYMPFTKSVGIQLPQESLKEIQIIDTPGVNDSVQSREERTRELLKVCDVIFIVSSAGQFMSSEDLELMDKITTKEGIREIYLLANMIDRQLYGSEMDEFDGNLNGVLNYITSELGQHASDILSKLKKTNPEVGSVFDDLILEGKSKVLHSSGLCYSMMQEFSHQEKWDDGMMTVWENLSETFPDNFSYEDEELSQASLAKLANIDNVKKVISEIKSKKDEILRKGINEFLAAKENATVEYQKDLIRFIENRLQQIQDTDIDEMKEQNRNFKNKENKASITLREEYQELVDELNINIKKTLSSDLDNYFKKSASEVDNAKDSETTSYVVGGWGWKGIIPWYTRKRTVTTEHLTVRAGTVRSQLEDLTLDIEMSISTNADEFILNWRKTLYKDLVSKLRDLFADEDLEPQLIRSAIRTVINSVEKPVIEYNGSFPNSLKKAGVLRDTEAETFFDDARNYISGLRRRVNKDIKEYSAELTKTLKKVSISDKIFSDYRARIELLENQIQNEEITLARFAKISDELKKIG